VKLLNRKKIKIQTPQTLQDNPLVKLEKAITAVKEFQENHEDIFQQYRDLTAEVDSLTDEAKTYAKQHECNIDGSTLFVKYSAGYKRWHDVDVLKKGMNAEEMKVAKAMKLFITEEKVDDSILKTLIRTKKLRAEIVKAAYRQEKTQDRAEIKEKNV
jgi:hypothetical protein